MIFLGSSPSCWILRSSAIFIMVWIGESPERVCSTRVDNGGGWLIGRWYVDGLFYSLSRG